MSQGSLVEEATLLLRKWLIATFKPGATIPVERVLARELQLKPYATNRAIGCLIAEGMVRRDGYKLSLAAPDSQQQMPFCCDLVLAQRSVFLKTYRKIAKELGITLKIHFWTCLEEAIEFLRQLDAPTTQGVLFDPPFASPPYLWEPAATKLMEHGIPVISIEQYTRKIPCILPDYTRALELGFSHMLSLGHKQLALAMPSPSVPSSVEILTTWKSLNQLTNLPASGARIFFQNNPQVLPEDAQALAKKLTSDWSDVTAVIVYGIFESAVQHLMDELERRNKSVPGDVSLLFLADLTQRHVFTPPVTCVAADPHLMRETAFLIVQRMAQKKHNAKAQPSPWRIRVEPSLSLKSSTAPTSSYIPPAKVADSAADMLFPGPGLETRRGKLKEELERVLRQAYERTAKVAASRFRSIDLKPYVNRPLNYRRGWLGDLPLKHFSPGAHVIHGVNFEVLGGAQRTDCGAVVFRSALNARGNKRELPTRLTIPINSRATAVYFLHGCGYSLVLHPFASYSFYSGTRKLGTVPLVALGQPPPDCDPRIFSRQSPQANIQDWWADFPHLDFDHARRVPIIEQEGDEPLHRHVYLYTLEWINPHPNVEISHLEVEVDFEQSTTLGLLAVSLLL
ncbi:MAG: substrate-binding domain-containing protein [Candidatus Methylacidiphilales bacterium]|nr:substrate-binding domain-containing protein [Candidatus Methylacidiphilales bacterium]